MTCLEPLPDASHMEFVLASLAWHLGEGVIDIMDHTVAYEALFHSFCFPLNVLLPLQDRRDDVSILHLQNLFDGKDPLSELLFLEFELLADFHIDRLEWVV